ncbi:MAG: peptide ABC transporter substrate-binding protein, partial [Caldilineaceae bacterium]|nr:peptide ABC transporter substrate-binding protein [Caldilineaceae bacterium]
TGLTVGLEVEALIYESLTRVDPEGNHVPMLAAEVPTLENGGVSEDLLTYTYQLRDDVTWHDGAPFTAADVVFTYEAIANPEVNARSRIGFELIESVESVDDHTVTFRLNQPSGVFLETWGYRGILPAHIFQNEDMNTSEHNRAPTVGTGPYRFVEWVSGDRIVVERNEDYYRQGG